MPRFLMAGIALVPLLLGLCAPSGSTDPEVVTLEIDAHTVPCMGEAPQRCLRVRSEPTEEWTNFFSSIEGFVHEDGYRYLVQIERRVRPDPPADGSRFRYRLIRILRKQAA